MRKNLLFLLLATSLLLSCKKETVDVVDGDYIKCTINEESFSSSFFVGATYVMDIFVITGTSNNGFDFTSLTIVNPEEGKTYKIEEINNELNGTGITVATETLGATYQASYASGGFGSITLTHFDGKSAAGTFNAEPIEVDGNKTTTITNGKFSISSINEF